MAADPQSTERIAPQSPRDTEPVIDASVGSIPSAVSRRVLSLPQKIGVGVAAVACAALIAVSAYALVVPADGGNAKTGSLLQTTVDSTSNVGSPNADKEPDSSAELSADSETSSSGSASVTESVTSSVPTQDTDVVANQETPTSSTDGESSGATNTSEAPETPAASTPAPATVTVSVSVSSSAAGGGVSGGTTVTFAQGATAYDALMACGLSVNASQSQYGVYVSAIGGLAEHDHGGSSGWQYSVNGSTPGFACSSYVLSDGDTVAWFYTL